MPSVILNFNIQLPQSLIPLYEGIADNSKILFNYSILKPDVDKYADEQYLPFNKFIFSLINKYKGKFKIAYVINGTTLELLRELRPDVIHSFRQLASTGCVDFFSKAFYNSLSWYYSKKEFNRQVKKHQGLIHELFGIESKVFRITDPEFTHELVKFIADTGFNGLLFDGEEKTLNAQNPDQIYSTAGIRDFGMLIRNQSLENMINANISNNNQNAFKALLETFFKQQSKNNSTTSLLLNAELFGLQNDTKAENFVFLEQFVSLLLGKPEWKFETPQKAIRDFHPKIKIDLPLPGITNSLQKESKSKIKNLNHYKTLEKIYSIEQLVSKSNLPGAYDQWGILQSIGQFFFKNNEEKKLMPNNFYTESTTNNEVAFSNYINALLDFEVRLIKKGLSEIKEKCKYAGALDLY